MQGWNTCALTSITIGNLFIDDGINIMTNIHLLKFGSSVRAADGISRSNINTTTSIATTATVRHDVSQTSSHSSQAVSSSQSHQTHPSAQDSSNMSTTSLPNTVQNSREMDDSRILHVKTNVRNSIDNIKTKNNNIPHGLMFNGLIMSMNNFDNKRTPQSYVGAEGTQSVVFNNYQNLMVLVQY